MLHFDSAVVFFIDTLYIHNVRHSSEKIQNVTVVVFLVIELIYTI